MELSQWVKSALAYAGKWPSAAADYFLSQYGLSSEFALKVAQLYFLLWAARLNPQVTSGFRDPAKQQAIRDAWDRGQKQGLAVRPADPKNSRHSVTSLGRPASKAVDIQTSNPKMAADIATSIGLRAGYYFQTPDPVHFDLG